MYGKTNGLINLRSETQKCCVNIAFYKGELGTFADYPASRPRSNIGHIPRFQVNYYTDTHSIQQTTFIQILRRDYSIIMNCCKYLCFGGGGNTKGR